MKARINYLICGQVCSVTVVFLLFYFSDKQNNTLNHFHRNFKTGKIIVEKTYKLPSNNFYFAGTDSGVVYLGNSMSANLLLVIRTSVRPLILNIEKNKLPVFQSSRLKVDSASIKLIDGSIPVIYNATLKTLQARPLKWNQRKFQDIAFISHESFVVKLIDRTIGTVLAKGNANTNIVEYKPEVLKKQVDGIFCRDGLLIFNPKLKKLVYCYLYRNQFVVTDTNLKVEYVGKTIDTISRAKIKLDTILKTNEIKMSSPPTQVNKHIATDGNLIFIHSLLQADNEDHRTFKNTSVIDIYDLGDSKYKYSFYIPNYHSEKMHDFRVRGSILYAIYNRMLVQYNLRPLDR